jgi:hypothetical protein
MVRMTSAAMKRARRAYPNNPRKAMKYAWDIRRAQSGYKKSKSRSKRKTTTRKKVKRKRRGVYMARRKKSYRRRGTSAKTYAKQALMGLGIATMLGGTTGALVGYVLGGPIVAGATFFAPQLRGTFANLTGTLTGGAQTTTSKLF